jgi:hypothetical protein
MKKLSFFILLAIVFILSGCSIGLTAKDKLDIADGIKTVHVEKNIPDVWKSEKGMDISISHEGFGKRADGNYCMTAGVTVGGEQYMPPTPLCNIGGEWKKVQNLPPPATAVAEQKVIAVPVLETKTKPAVVHRVVKKVQHVSRVTKPASAKGYGVAKPASAKGYGVAKQKNVHSKRVAKFTEIK